ncbi:hypothetical protein BN1183_BQ_00010 [Pantoea ananatis]|nr:hypothetical protein BN1183_BQ_00010 [Pantoea ananatis]
MPQVRLNRKAVQWMRQHHPQGEAHQAEAILHEPPNLSVLTPDCKNLFVKLTFWGIKLLRQASDNLKRLFARRS